MSRTLFCIKCAKNLTVENFHAKLVRPRSKRGTCKPCYSLKTRAWQIANPEVCRKARHKRTERASVTVSEATCRICEMVKATEYFAVATISVKTGRGRCKACDSKKSVAYLRANKDKKARWYATSPKYKAYASSWQKKNRGAINIRHKAWRDANPDKMKSISARYRKNNFEKEAVRRAEREARMKRKLLQPSHAQEIRNIYAEARRLRKTTGENYHVDHIIPLNGKTVSGLHVPRNLQILTATENCRKKNSFEETVL